MGASLTSPASAVRLRVGGYVELEPLAGLSPYIECQWAHAVGELAPGTSHRVVPDDAASLAFWCRRDACGRVREGRLTVIGPIRSPRTYLADSGHELVAVKFKPEWFHTVFASRASDHADNMVDVAQPFHMTELQDQLAETRDWRAALTMLDTAVTDRVQRRISTRRSAEPGQRALSLLRVAPANRPLEWTAAQLGVSLRQLRRVVRDSTDTSPKSVTRIWRFLRTLADADTANRATQVRWAALALRHGYADQSHLVNEFRELSGETPQRLLAERRAESSSCPAPL